VARPLLLVSAAGGKRILIDPVFSDYAAPFSFINKAFPGDYPWRAEGMPEIDLLIISHDHYDHLDYATIKALMPKIKRVVTPLGVGRICATGAWRAPLSAKRTGIRRCRSATS
jgi:L-ascorbate metabolism protein UlaG (beta-lactamase superfamily)